MAFTALATRLYKDPITTVYLNSLKQNDDYFIKGVAKAWVNFDGSTATMTSRAAHGVTNITDNAIGKYTITFTTGFASTGYCRVLGGEGTPGAVRGYLTINLTAIATTAIQVIGWDDNGGTNIDHRDVNVACFGVTV